MAEHPGNRFARGALCLSMGKHAPVKHLDASSGLDNRSNDPSMVSAFHTDGCHRRPSWLHRVDSGRQSREGL